MEQEEAAILQELNKLKPKGLIKFKVAELTWSPDLGLVYLSLCLFLRLTCKSSSKLRTVALKRRKGLYCRRQGSCCRKRHFISSLKASASLSMTPQNPKPQVKLQPQPRTLFLLLSQPLPSSH